MRLLILFISFLISQIADSQIISASPPYRVRSTAAGCTDKLLDTYSGALAGYSLRLIDCQYAGALIRVRRSSDNAEADISADANGNLDTTALKNHVGTGGTDDGFVTTWYSQTGSNNATQTTAGNQPKIMDNGVIYRVELLPSIYFDWTDGLNAHSMGNIAVLDAYFITSTSDNQYLWFYAGDGSAYYGYAASSGSGSTGLYGNFGSPSLYYNNNLFAGTTRGDLHTALNGHSLIVVQGANTESGTWATGPYFYMFKYGSFEFTGYVSEMIFYNSNQSANRTGIQTNINTYWQVY